MTGRSVLLKRLVFSGELLRAASLGRLGGCICSLPHREFSLSDLDDHYVMVSSPA
jgi:hypothetical protein